MASYVEDIGVTIEVTFMEGITQTSVYTYGAVSKLHYGFFENQTASLIVESLYDIEYVNIFLFLF